jgi:hypothetical protein
MLQRIVRGYRYVRTKQAFDELAAVPMLMQLKSEGGLRHCHVQNARSGNISRAISLASRVVRANLGRFFGCEEVIENTLPSVAKRL